MRQQKTENFWRPLFQLNIEAEVIKLHVGISLNLIDTIIPKKLFASLKLASAEAIKLSKSEMHFADIKMSKKEFFLAFSLQNFYTSIYVFKASKNIFRPSLLDKDKKIWFCQFHNTILAPKRCIPKI